MRGLVLELVEGETLAQRLASGPLPVQEAIEVARQIADALEAAHEKGVIHRDLKPANLAITHDGTVKVRDLDWQGGRADAAEEEASPARGDRHHRRGDARRHHRGHGRVHEPRAGARQGSTSGPTSGRSAAPGTRC